MYDQAVDGNLAALKKYEDMIDKQEEALTSILDHDNFVEKLDQINELATELHEEFDNKFEWDFCDEIASAIREVI